MPSENQSTKPVRCATVSYGKVRGAAKRWRYWQPAVYEHYLSKDGLLKWKYVCHIGTARRSERLATEDALEYAEKKGREFLEGIRQYAPVNGSES